MCGPHQRGVRHEGQPAVHTPHGRSPRLVTLAGSPPLPPSAASPPRIQMESQNTTARAALHYTPLYTGNKQLAQPQCVVVADYCYKKYLVCGKGHGWSILMYFSVNGLCYRGTLLFLPTPILKGFLIKQLTVMLHSKMREIIPC